MCVLLYLEHVRVFVMAVLYNHSLVSGQSVGDAVLALTVYSLQQNSDKVRYSLTTATKSQVIYHVTTAKHAVITGKNRVLF